MKFKVGQKVEECGDRNNPETFGGFWACEVTKVLKGKKYEVVYEDIVDDEDESQKRRDVLEERKLRPRCADDSRTKPLWQRNRGDMVDIWTAAGWWQGYVTNTYDDRIDAFYPHPGASSETYTVYANPEDDPEEDPEEQCRVRTGMDWDTQAERWVPRPPKLSAKGEDRRDPARLAQLRQQWAAAQRGGQQQQQQQKGKDQQQGPPAAARGQAKPSAQPKPAKPAAAAAPVAAAKKQPLANPAARAAVISGARAAGVLGGRAAVAAAGWSEEDSSSSSEEERSSGSEDSGSEEEEGSTGQQQQAQPPQRAQQALLFESSDDEDVPLSARKRPRPAEQPTPAAQRAQRGAEPGSSDSDSQLDVPLTQRKKQLGAANKRSQQQQQQQQQAAAQAAVPSGVPAAAAPAPAPAPALSSDSGEGLLLGAPGGGGLSDGEGSGGLGALVAGLNDEAPGERALGSAHRTIARMVDSLEGLGDEWGRDRVAARQQQQRGGGLDFLTSPASVSKQEPSAGLPPRAAGSDAAPGAGVRPKDLTEVFPKPDAAAGVSPNLAPQPPAVAAAAPKASAAAAPAVQPAAPAAAARAAGAAEAGPASRGEASTAVDSEPVTSSVGGAAEQAASESAGGAAGPQQGGGGAKGEGEASGKQKRKVLTEEEKAIMIQIIREYGKDYDRLEKALPGRGPKSNLASVVCYNMNKGLRLSQYFTADGMPIGPAPASAAGSRQQRQGAAVAPAAGARQQQQQQKAAAAPAAGTRHQQEQQQGLATALSAEQRQLRRTETPFLRIELTATGAGGEGKAKEAAAAAAGAEGKPQKAAAGPAAPERKQPKPNVPGEGLAAKPGPAPATTKAKETGGAAKPAAAAAPAPAPAPAKPLIPRKKSMPPIPAPGAGAGARTASAGGSGVFIIPKKAPAPIVEADRGAEEGEAEPALKRKRSAGQEPVVAAVGAQRRRSGGEDNAADAAADHVPLDFSTVYCIDNIGGGVTTEALQQALDAQGIRGIKSLQVASVPLDNGVRHMAGYAVLHFHSRQDAFRELPRLTNLCMVTPACPIPRPLIVHAPRLAAGYPWGQGAFPGHLSLLDYDKFTGQLRDFKNNPHFAQASSLEFDMALSWRKLLRTLREAKGRACDRHAQELAEVFQRFQEDLNSPQAEAGDGAAPMQLDTADPPPPPPPPPPPVPRLEAEEGGWEGPASCCLLLKGISPPQHDGTHEVVELQERLRKTFEQFGYPQQVDLLRDPVTGRLSGHAVVRMESAQRVELVCTNLREMVFLFNGTPRPLEAAVARPGPPRGSQAVYDRALRAVFGRDDSSAKGGEGLELREVPDSCWASPAASLAERAAVYLRRLMAGRQLPELDQLERSGLERSLALAAEQEAHYDRESAKLAKLRDMTMLPIFKKLISAYCLPRRDYKHSGAARRKRLPGARPKGGGH